MINKTTINGLKTLLVVFIAILFINCSHHKIPNAILKAIDLRDGEYTIKNNKNDIVKVIDWKSQQGTNYTEYYVIYEVTDTANSSRFIDAFVYEYDNKSKLEISIEGSYHKLSNIVPYLKHPYKKRLS